MKQSSRRTPPQGVTARPADTVDWTHHTQQEAGDMNIFISYFAATDHLFHSELVKALREKKHKAYPKHLKAFFGVGGLHDPDELDEHLRDEDLAIIMLSKDYISDRWLRGELHALLTLERKLRPNFVVPIFLDGIEDEDI
ncbi:MAG TPA: TIR domain-containing protein, partial [Pyrinomonadaceae bacterium]